MSRGQREEWTAAMRGHEREVANLSQALAHVETTLASGAQMQQQVLYLTAQVMKHQISMALLAARLVEPAVLAH
jgi:hypothetical protein